MSFEPHIELISRPFPDLIIIHATYLAVPSREFGQMTYEAFIASVIDSDLGKT